MDKEIRKEFPILDNITYFDSAALVLKPKMAVDAISEFYSSKSISSRTADTPLGNLINQKIEQVRSKIAKLVDAKPNEVIFTSGTTESINLFAKMFERLLQPNDIILLNAYNHSSNMIPWIEIAKTTKAFVKISENIIEDISKYDNLKVVALSQETNNFAQEFDLNKIHELASAKGAIVFNDAAQAISHHKVSITNSDAIAFSTNKFYGPTGLGALIIHENILSKLWPVKFGGGTVNQIDSELSWVSKSDIRAFEPGTPDLAGIYMFDKSLEFFEAIGYKKTQDILTKLSIYLHEKLSKLDNVEVFSKPGDFICLINVKGIHPQDVATYLGSKNIYTISGIFCAQYLRNLYSEQSYLRISLGIYNNFSDIDKLVEELKNGGDFYAF
ncbi:aminotransferase class V-fold PLP-dependent enzyme [Mycoplasmopsis edwardii]|nr:aminotransferase class V-fold PLP-dependent enzyme [Mycoplasmopsis edwardii]